MTVSVTSAGTTTVFTQATDTAEVKTTSTVFYTQENEDGYVEVYFGDGVLGQELYDGDMISVTYIIVDGVHAEGSKNFTQITAVNGYNSSTVVATVPATGGAEKESIESIKFKATKFYTSQNRLVTLNDYKAKVTDLFVGRAGSVRYTSRRVREICLLAGRVLVALCGRAGLRAF